MKHKCGTSVRKSSIAADTHVKNNYRKFEPTGDIELVKC